MEKIHLIGSEGFIGRALQKEVANNFDMHCWSHRFSDSDHHFDLLDATSWHSFLEMQPKYAILLSWPGLPNYQNSFHLTRNLPACINLIDQMKKFGVKNLLIAGTCYEYGLKNGALNEAISTEPQNSYAIAKDSLRRYLDTQEDQSDMRWCWARIFYPIGNGQSENSLVPSLVRAIKAGDPTFPISSGCQLRDFINVECVAQKLLSLITCQEAKGVFNVGSGSPRSVLDLVKKIKKDYSSDIKIEIGRLPVRLDEPQDFWADMSKFNSLIQ